MTFYVMCMQRQDRTLHHSGSLKIHFQVSFELSATTLYVKDLFFIYTLLLFAIETCEVEACVNKLRQTLAVRLGLRRVNVLATL